MCQKKQDCKSAAAGTVGMCVTGSLLAAVGKYVYGVWEIYFPCHMNVLFHGGLTGYAHFHGAPPSDSSPQVLQVAPDLLWLSPHIIPTFLFLCYQ